MWLAQISSFFAEATPKVRAASDTDRIEFLIVLIGVIVGLSIGKLVKFIGDFLVHRKNGKASFVHGTFVTTLFLFQVYYWWDMWDLKENLKQADAINFWMFIRLLLIPLCLFCATALLCPNLKYPKGDQKLSLGEHFEEHCRPFYILWVVLCLIGISQAIDLHGEGMEDPHIYIRIIVAALFLTGFIVKKAWFNRILAVLMFTLLLAYITVPVWVPYWLNLSNLDS